MSGTFPDTYGILCMSVNSWRVRGPSCHRHGERHGEIGLGKLYSRPHDGADAHDADIRAYSREGMRRYLLGTYPFNLTRRTRRAEQKTLFLCCSRAYNLCRVFSDWLIARRRHPTTGYPCRRVCREHRRVLVGNPTARNPLLAPNTPAIVGFVGFYVSGGAANKKWSARLLAVLFFVDCSSCPGGVVSAPVVD